MKKLKELLNGVNVGKVYGDTDREIGHIHFDSRKIEPGDVFIAQRGVNADGHAFIDKALTRGAVAVVCEQLPENRPEEVTYIWTADTSEALGVMAGNYWDNPSRELKLVGVTGTNGKTTTATLLYELVRLAGEKAGLLSTVCNYIGEEKIPATHTTPDALSIQELLRRMVDAGCRYCFMEASSHAIHQKRIAGLDFDGAIFSNITHDHLDYHKTMENYKAAKGMLFARAAKSVINMDDAAGAYMKEQSKGEVLTIGVDCKADLTAEGIDVSADGTAFDMLWQGKRYPVHLHTPGRFSVYNALGAAGACILLGVPVEEIVAGLTANPGVSGRFQTVRSKRGCQAVVDYAHTPDGLENVLNTANEFVKGKLIAVFGCGGDRDRTKRPIMGEIGGRLAGYCIITSDNPRTEDPEKILEDVEVGVKKTDCPYEKIVDRREAIQKAVAMAEAGDVILIAGKGHETYQIFPDKTIHFDDIEEVRKAFGEDCL